MSELAAVLAEQPGLVDRLLAEHVPDEVQRCVLCSAGPQAGRQTWPCRTYAAASAAARLLAGGQR